MRKLRVREANWLALGHTAGRESSRIKTDSGPSDCVPFPWSLFLPRPSPLIHLQMRPSFSLSQVILRGTASQEGSKEMGSCSPHCSFQHPASPPLPVSSTDTAGSTGWNGIQHLPPTNPQNRCCLPPIYSSFPAPRVKPWDLYHCSMSWTRLLSIPAAPGQPWSLPTGCLYSPSPGHSPSEGALEILLLVSTLLQTPSLAPHFI